MTLEKLLQSDIYADYLEELDKDLPRQIDRKAKVHKVIMDLQNEWLDEAGVTTDDLFWLIRNHRKSTIHYITTKQTTYTEPNGGRDNIVNLPPTIIFPIGHLIEFFLALKTPAKLLSYIKTIRIPRASTYHKEITNIFNNSQKIT
ncbi:hypothetical protein [Pseudomonas fluorescens]|uniref:hypothetical protein n=1 Tax=Pseudomonas fluorescens TaxID=294 RepID=UPI0018F7F162|nr:hypothetical protein [Pseudomonas fluorescens]